MIKLTMENALRTMMTGIRGRILAVVVAIGLIPVAAPLFANTGTDELAPVARHEKIGQLVTEFIQKSHYRHAAVDDDLSSLVMIRTIREATVQVPAVPRVDTHGRAGAFGVP